MMMAKLHSVMLCCLILLGQAVFVLADPPASKIPEGFVDIKEVVPTVALDIRYYTSHNFLGKPVDGYFAPKCILTKEAARALKKVQEEMVRVSLSLKIYDCYRPQRAVNHFIEWAKNISDTKMKKEFYATINKKVLFREGYIAHKSGHSRGSTVDLTIARVPIPEQGPYNDGRDLRECYLPWEKRFKDNSIDMGTGFDCFHERSWTANNQIGAQQRANRLLLKTLMEKHGFRNYRKEWWHFTLENEPFPTTYFDFIIE
jgi:D-alanyl-D-alanine dipeptidase